MWHAFVEMRIDTAIALAALLAGLGVMLDEFYIARTDKERIQKWLEASAPHIAPGTYPGWLKYGAPALLAGEYLAMQVFALQLTVIMTDEGVRRYWAALDNVVHVTPEHERMVHLAAAVVGLAVIVIILWLMLVSFSATAFIVVTLLFTYATRAFLADAFRRAASPSKSPFKYAFLFLSVAILFLKLVVQLDHG